VKVRKVLSADGSHEHIEGVCTDGGRHYTRQQVVDSISAGDVWKTCVGGYEAPIGALASCPWPGCPIAPYLRTNTDSPEQQDLENLDRC
jgi:hypothetical protein